MSDFQKWWLATPTLSYAAQLQPTSEITFIGLFLLTIGSLLLSLILLGYYMGIRRRIDALHQKGHAP